MRTEQSTTPGVGLPALRKSESLWADAFDRLLRNRAAIVGGIIILLLVLVYIFADVVAVKPYDVQVPPDNNTMPQWLISVFPMVPTTPGSTTPILWAPTIWAATCSAALSMARASR